MSLASSAINICSDIEFILRGRSFMYDMKDRRRTQRLVFRASAKVPSLFYRCVACPCVRAPVFVLKELLLIRILRFFFTSISRSRPPWRCRCQRWEPSPRKGIRAHGTSLLFGQHGLPCICYAVILYHIVKKFDQFILWCTSADFRIF
jgi:hypothetical protein